jgi:hypothetical protein
VLSLVGSNALVYTRAKATVRTNREESKSATERLFPIIVPQFYSLLHITAFRKAYFGAFGGQCAS